MRKHKVFESNKKLVSYLIMLCVLFLGCATKENTYSKIGLGWSNNSVNTVKFRKNALTTYKNYQFIAYYDENSFLTLGKRKISTSFWEKVITRYKGNTNDAHNSISIAIDGDGYLHVSWDHHNTSLRYAKSKLPLSLDLGNEEKMTGIQEDKITYPEFYNLPNGNILFFYRSGESGKGNMVINTYDVKSKQWFQLHDNLLDGEEKRSAYWQACVDNEERSIFLGCGEKLGMLKPIMTYVMLDQKMVGKLGKDQLERNIIYQ